MNFSKLFWVFNQKTYIYKKNIVNNIKILYIFYIYLFQVLFLKINGAVLFYEFNLVQAKFLYYMQLLKNQIITDFLKVYKKTSKFNVLNMFDETLT